MTALYICKCRKRYKVKSMGDQPHFKRFKCKCGKIPKFKMIL